MGLPMILDGPPMLGFPPSTLLVLGMPAFDEGEGLIGEGRSFDSPSGVSTVLEKLDDAVTADVMLVVRDVWSESVTTTEPLTS